MNLINLILIGLIFVSLIVIIVIFGRNAKKIGKIKLEDGNGGITGGQQGKKNPIARFFGAIFSGIKGFFLMIAEWVVKKSKELLHLVHFWLIKKRKGKNGNGVQGEIEAKEELVMEEERNLDKVINEDLGQAEEDAVSGRVGTGVQKKSAREPVVRAQEGVVMSEKMIESPEAFIQEKKKTEQIEIQNQEEGGQSIAIQDQESVEEVPLNASDSSADVLEEGKKKGFFGRFFRKKNKEGVESELSAQEDRGDAVNLVSSDDNFSDGVVRVEKNGNAGDENFVNDVVVAQKIANEASDEDLGIDRKILEKKILQKIEKDPKSVGNFQELGELYIKMENFSDAEETYKFILGITPRDADAKRKLEKIKLLKRLK